MWELNNNNLTFIEMKTFIFTTLITLLTLASCTKDNSNEQYEALNGDVYERPIEKENKSNR